MTADVSLVTQSTDPEITAALTVYERLRPLQDALGLGNLTVPEMQLFAMVAHHTGLDPFTKQIYAIKRGGKVMHQTGIDGYRSTAERTREYRGSDAPVFEPCDCGDPGSPPSHPKVARVTVYRAFPEGVRGQPGEARWHELKPAHTKGTYGYADDMWWQMPENQLAKCAEANGLRKAFPRVLGGVYITDEMEQAGPAEATPLVEAATKPTARERVAARREAIEGQFRVAEDHRQLANDDLVALIRAAEIPAERVREIRGAMFPGVHALGDLSDDDRGRLWAALSSPVEAASVPMFDDEEKAAILAREEAEAAGVGA